MFAADFCAKNMQRYIEGAMPNNAKQSPISIESVQALTENALKNAFINIDNAFIKQYPQESERCGSTASVAVIQDVVHEDEPHSVTTLLTVGHIGDTKIISCDNVTGKAKILTVDHVASRPSERQRIEKAGGYISTDSFGQQAVMGTLAVTRAFGVRKYKDNPSDIIIADPFIQSHIVDDKQSFLVLVSDGVTSVMSEQEIVDIVKHCISPTVAVNTLLDLVEQYSTRDNYSAVVVRLPCWTVDKKPPPTKDYTQNLRRYKLKHSDFGSRMTEGVGSESLDSVASADDQTQELSHDRFIIALFDAVGKDIGRSDVSDLYSSVNDTTSRFAFRGDSGAGNRGIGRLTFNEFLAGMAELNVKAAKSTSPVTMKTLAREIFASVGTMKDIEQNSAMIMLDSRAKTSPHPHSVVDDHHVEIELAQKAATQQINTTALSATDIVRALKKLQYHIFR